MTTSQLWNSTCLLSYSSEGQKPKISFSWLKLRCQQGWFLLEAPEENIFPCFFQLLEAADNPWLVAAYHYDLCCHCHITFSDSDPPAFLL